MDKETQIWVKEQLRDGMAEKAKTLRNAADSLFISHEAKEHVRSRANEAEANAERLQQDIDRLKGGE